MKKLVCALMCVLMLLLCACQPTPDEEYVVNKGDNIAEEKINATALPVDSAKPTETENSTEAAETEPAETSPWGEATGQAVFPERWEGNIKTDYKEMIISADVIVSGTESYPVHLVKKSSISEEVIAKAAKHLFRDVTGWRNGTTPSREYIAEAIQYVANSDMEESEKAEQLETLNYEFSHTSVSDADVTPCSSIEDIPSFGLSGVTVFTGDGSGTMYKTEDVFGASANPYGLVIAKSGQINDPDSPDFSAEISLDEATAKANEFLAAIDMEGFELYFSDEAGCIDAYSAEVIDTGWELRFIRSYGYAPFSVSEYDASESGAFSFDNKWGRAVTEYSEPVKEETIRLYVSSRGVESVRMFNHYEPIGIANENVQLYDFNELTNRIKLLLTAAINSPYQSEGYYVIEEMILTVVPAPKKDSSDYYMMPVWVCKIGSYVSLGDGLGVSPFYIPGEQVFCGWLTLAFNAIDGTRVSLPQG